MAPSREMSKLPVHWLRSLQSHTGPKCEANAAMNFATRATADNWVLCRPHQSTSIEYRNDILCKEIFQCGESPF